MNKAVKVLIIVLVVVGLYFLLVPSRGGSKNVNNGNNGEENEGGYQEIKKEMSVVIDGISYPVTLENNDAVYDLLKLLPLEIKMNELNGNEKYHYLDASLKISPMTVGTIEKGDIMIYQGDCLVLFYKTFDTSFSYTKIGHIDNLPDLGSEDITVTFE